MTQSINGRWTPEAGSKAFLDFGEDGALTGRRRRQPHRHVVGGRRRRRARRSLSSSPPKWPPRA
ncbi:hypothetical protein IOD13_04900 [Brevibacterium casei]|nr:hypothetical protein [Brevibacterium casei]